MKRLTISQLIILTSTLFILFYNLAFFDNLTDVYPLGIKNLFHILSISIVCICVVNLILSLTCYRHTVKPVLIFLLLVSSMTSYFMDTYNVVIDSSMIDNILATDTAESIDLINIRLILYVIILGIIPSALVYRLNIIQLSPKNELISKFKIIALSISVSFILISSSSAFYTSFFREHKPLRYYSNPSYYIYSLANYFNDRSDAGNQEIKPIAEDAKIPESDIERELVILVVGETARADHFSLNGYPRETNPELRAHDVFSFSNVWACGTSTATSVPCMFSIQGRADYSKEESNSTENVLDILNRSGVNVKWIDNNSSSKGVALRIPHESYRKSDKNPVCDIECRDEGMLSDLQEYIDSHPQGDIFIVLHQMGNHGPAYYKRYPKEFETFRPTCKTNHLDDCSDEEIANAYDNAILYTDYFLSKTIALLKTNDDEFEAALFYISDHGESLGEKGHYLHGLPYFFAPDSQKRVPMVMWFGKNFDREEADLDNLSTKLDQKFSHDNIFHTILGLMEITTSVYRQEMDIIDR
ncbi:MAG: phosphoethanolamine--lipid A transferase [Gammaproteobacteria bacterium]|nr:phosphoethanolamine--lipid A transferase [Gammaproteobacteria bacterium]